jgi:hypothetical protein
VDLDYPKNPRSMKMGLDTTDRAKIAHPILPRQDIFGKKNRYIPPQTPKYKSAISTCRTVFAMTESEVFKMVSKNAVIIVVPNIPHINGAIRRDPTVRINIPIDSKPPAAMFSIKPPFPSGIQLLVIKSSV